MEYYVNKSKLVFLTPLWGHHYFSKYQELNYLVYLNEIKLLIQFYLLPLLDNYLSQFRECELIWKC